jgi:cell division protease FtsH
VLRSHRKSLDSLALALLQHETLDEIAAYEAAGIARPERRIANDAGVRTERSA